MNKFRQDNEVFLDRTFAAFREEVLGRLDRRPNAFMDASFAVSIHGGRITLQQSETCEEGRRYTEKTKP